LGQRESERGLPLHITTSLRIVAKRRQMPGIPMVQARDLIEDLATRMTLTRDDTRLIEDLEGRTGVLIAELAKLTKEWPPKGRA
jgi:hypothetical protein